MSKHPFAACISAVKEALSPNDEWLFLGSAQGNLPSRDAFPPLAGLCLSDRAKLLSH
jgi:hypothetical protein